jgi:transposase-like protein
MKPEELNLIKLASEYSDNDKARDLLESLRWPNGPVCPHCKSEKNYKLTPRSSDPTKGVRKGVYKCANCRKQYTVTVGTIFEDSHIPIGKWLMAIFLVCSAKKGMSAHQLHRSLGITYKTAWFMAHRIRYVMTEGPLAKMLEGAVEVDETYVGGKDRGGLRGRGSRKKTPVVALVSRDGEVGTKAVDRVTAKNLHAVIRRTSRRNP